MRQLIYLFVLILTVISFSQQAGDLVEVTSVNPAIKLDLRYATENNFLKKQVYPEARCFVRYEAAKQLNDIQNELETLGLGLKIFDGYRPHSVQKQMWEILPDTNYVADPARGSRHNRGAAVDVTLIDSLGNELPMPTGFDDFTAKADHTFMKLPANVCLNRWILKTIMEKHGFKSIKEEWWHYDLIGWEKYDVLDLSFDEIKKNMKQ